MLPIARLLKSNGTDGELVMGLQGIAPEDIDVKEPVFIRFDGLPVPFFIGSLTPRGTGKVLVRLTGIRSLRDAEEVAGRTVYVEDDDGEGLEDLTGWTVLDAQGRTVGTIAGHADIPGNPCVHVDTADGQVMLPLHEDLILSVDGDRRTIVMTVPDGLI